MSIIIINTKKFKEAKLIYKIYKEDLAILKQIIKLLREDNFYFNNSFLEIIYEYWFYLTPPPSTNEYWLQIQWGNPQYYYIIFENIYNNWNNLLPLNKKYIIQKLHLLLATKTIKIPAISRDSILIQLKVNLPTLE